MVRSSEPLAMSLPLALTASVLSRRVWPAGGVVSSLLNSQILTVLSTLADKMKRASGLKAQEETQSPWPRRLRSSVPFWMSQTLTIRSPPPEASSRPSLLNATLLTGLEWPLNSATAVGAPVSGIFQILTILSPPHVAIFDPSG